MGILDDTNNKMHETKGKFEGKMESNNIDDKAKAKFEEMRRKRAESNNQTEA